MTSSVTGIDYSRYSTAYYAKHKVKDSSSPKVEQSAIDENLPKNVRENACTDGNDDGKIGFWSALGNIVEGV